MNGILIIDKPAGLTSHDVVARVRRILKTKRVGHTGTLDPFATGVMTLLIGKATRLAQFVDRDEKEYLATLRFGFETDTGDLTGSPVIKATFDLSDAEGDRDIEWHSVLEKFKGVIRQVPPMYSAKKIEGKKLYELARRGISVERSAVEVMIRELELVSITPFILRVACSAGTYIRALAVDIGREVGKGAHLTDLRRIRSGHFTIGDTVTLEDLAKADEPEDRLLPIDVAVGSLPTFVLPLDRVGRTLSGLATRVSGVDFCDGEHVRMHTPEGELIAIGAYSANELSIQPKVVLG